MDLNTHQKLTLEEIEHVKAITNSGKLYYDYDPLIEKARNYAFYICREYNRSQDLNLLKELFGKMDENAQIEYNFITEFGFNLYSGKNLIIGNDVKMIDCNVITIGDNVNIGSNVGMYTSNHALDPEKRANHWCSEQPITIGDNVSIGNDVTILPGITIGDNTIIESGSVVTKDISANKIASGVPCREVENLN
ncbi:sugar O-acetyltransferase [Ligilactobacillus sp. LYQ135]